MLSSQSPVIVARNGKVVLVTGSPGSRTIINTVLCMLINVLDYGMNIRAAVDAPRLHHQWFPDAAHLEVLASHPDLAEALRKLGHRLSSARQGDAHSIWVDPKTGLYYGRRTGVLMERLLGTEPICEVDALGDKKSVHSALQKQEETD